MMQRCNVAQVQDNDALQYTETTRELIVKKIVSFAQHSNENKQQTTRISSDGK
jgi:hypothetical protein